MEKVYDPIGSTFKEGDVMLKVVEIKNYRTCKGCWYASNERYKSSCYTHPHLCTSGTRPDGKQVIFKKV